MLNVAAITSSSPLSFKGNKKVLLACFSTFPTPWVSPFCFAFKHPAAGYSIHTGFGQKRGSKLPLYKYLQQTCFHCWKALNNILFSSPRAIFRFSFPSHCLPQTCTFQFFRPFSPFFGEIGPEHFAGKKVQAYRYLVTGRMLQKIILLHWINHTLGSMPYEYHLNPKDTYEHCPLSVLFVKQYILNYCCRNSSPKGGNDLFSFWRRIFEVRWMRRGGIDYGFILPVLLSIYVPFPHPRSQNSYADRQNFLSLQKEMSG